MNTRRHSSPEGVILHSYMPPAIFIDFDGTVVPYDVEFELFARLGGPDRAGDVVARWERGELDVPERLRLGFNALRGSGLTRDQLESFLDRVPIEPSFPAFLDYLDGRGWPFAILSDGLIWYIEYILRRHHIDPLPPIISNDVDFEHGWQLRFPNRNGDCPPCRQCATCKRYAVRDARSWADPIVFIGDGRADRWAAAECDIAFAREPLLSILQGWGRPGRLFGFSDFSGIRQRLEELSLSGRLH